MPLINLIIALIIVGVALWRSNRFIPMVSRIQASLNVVVTAFVGISVLQAVGLWRHIGSYKLSR